MSRPLHSRRLSGTSHANIESEDTDRMEKEDSHISRSLSEHSFFSLRFPAGLFSDNSSKLGINENGFVGDPFSVASARSRHKLTLLLLKITLVVILILALIGSFWWTLSLTATSRGHIVHSYRKLQEQLVSDLWDEGELSMGPKKVKELGFCLEEYKNFAPCYNISENLALGHSDGREFDRLCYPVPKKSCLVLPPGSYRIPLPWPTGRDVIWVGNVRITAEEVLSSGSLTKGMMMLEEEQISFRSASFNV